MSKAVPDNSSGVPSGGSKNLQPPVDLFAPELSGAFPAALRDRSVNLREELNQITALSERLLSGTSLNDFNRETLSDILEESNKLSKDLPADGPVTDDSILKTFTALRSWFFFTLQNQSYCSPAHQREDTIFQGGVISISKWIKYLRSEINTPVFGEAYDRNQVVIRAESSDSFADLAAKYVVHAPRKKLIELPPSGSLAEFIRSDSNGDHMIVVNASKETFPECLRQLEQVMTEVPDFEGGIYFRSNSPITAEVREQTQELILANDSNIQVVSEEAYDPFETGSAVMRKIIFLHNQKEKFRYQLIQDAASMGYRPTLNGVVQYYFQAGRLEEFLNTTVKTEDNLISYPGDRKVEAEGPNLDEQNDDYQILLDTLGNCIEELDGFEASQPIEQRILERTHLEAKAISSELEAVLSKPEAAVAEVSETFHRSYYRLRTLVQYTAKIGQQVNPHAPEAMEEKISGWEGGTILATNSGMTATRTAITTLADQVGHAYSCPHYWETDFLTQNLFEHNFHYPDIANKAPSRLTSIKHDASDGEIDGLVDTLVTQNPTLPGGQLLCFDRSIAPFFFTRIFNLEHLCQSVSTRSSELKHPVYFVVDNTLDFDDINQESLFPDGIPKNVFLIFTPSLAKLHQLGFDAVTGGAISIHCHPDQRNEALRLHGAFEERLQAEGSRQTPYGLRFLMRTYYQHHAHSTMADYENYMLEKRKRNTTALIAQINASLGPLARKTSRGEFEIKNPRKSTDQISIDDPEPPGEKHIFEVSFHYEPNSAIHAYLKIQEPERDKYITGKIFEEIKRRVFKAAAMEGIHLADGTSWGFPITRMDWYMHTMRISVGLEHQHNMKKFGAIYGSVIKELLLYPDDFLTGTEVLPMKFATAQSRADEIIKLDRFIPYDPDNPTPRSYYLEDQPGKWDYSFVLDTPTGMASMLLAYGLKLSSDKIIYLSKAATHPDFQGRGYFRRMLEHLKDRARSDDIKRIVLLTSASKKNEYVVKAYEKCGFQVTDLEGQMLDNGWPLIFMEMELKVDGAPDKVKHFSPVPDALYQEIKDKGDLSPLEDYKAVVLQK